MAYFVAFFKSQPSDEVQSGLGVVLLQTPSMASLVVYLVCFVLPTFLFKARQRTENGRHKMHTAETDVIVLQNNTATAQTLTAANIQFRQLNSKISKNDGVSFCFSEKLKKLDFFFILKQCFCCQFKPARKLSPQSRGYHHTIIT